MFMKTHALFFFTLILAVCFLGYDVFSLVSNGLNFNQHIPFLMSGVLSFFVWCLYKNDQIMWEKPQIIKPEDLPEGVTPIGRYLKEAAMVEAESLPPVPEGYDRTKDGKYVVPSHVLRRVDSDGLG